MESSLKINTTPEYIKSADVYALSAYHTYTVCLNHMVRLQLELVLRTQITRHCILSIIKSDAEKTLPI